jgi:hypothetical protein
MKLNCAIWSYSPAVTQIYIFFLFPARERRETFVCEYVYGGADQFNAPHHCFISSATVPYGGCMRDDLTHPRAPFTIRFVLLFECTRERCFLWAQLLMNMSAATTVSPTLIYSALEIKTQKQRVKIMSPLFCFIWRANKSDHLIRNAVGYVGELL